MLESSLTPFAIVLLRTNVQLMLINASRYQHNPGESYVFDTMNCYSSWTNARLLWHTNAMMVPICNMLVVLEHESIPKLHTHQQTILSQLYDVVVSLPTL
jgi:hypothetical protein